jgi:hypothetical protein
MHGDFSRGHRPDRKRGQEYTRAFAQERRLLLDSDLNAATDALHERLRGLANHLGCPKGSPDLGYLVTPGRLLALFRDLDDVVVSSANMTFHREYGTKYLDRYPSIHLLADQGVQGTITLRLRSEVTGNVVVWCRRDAAATVTVGGQALAVPLAADLAAAPPVNLAAPVTEVVLTLDAGGEIWVGMIETEHDAGPLPEFHFASGSFSLDGLPLHNPADAVWVTNAPAGGNFAVLAANDRLLVFLEGWERHVTFVEDLGLLERALGGDTDTMTRGQATGQVKLALVPAAFDLDAFARALASPILTAGTLDVTTPPAPPNPDPCALPVQGGYTGRDNRFYRFEVHTGGALGVATIKWSRDNGSELFAVTEAANNAELTFPSNTLLQGGDLVEIFTADSIELGDQTPAVLDGVTQTFTPSVRSVGVLARLVGPTSNGGATFTLTNPNGLGVVNLPLHYGPFPVQTLKVRRWHGLIDAPVVQPPDGVEVENGLRITLAGTFSPGDYWQYEARAAGDNDNGPFQILPHGPERDFTPLALMQFSAQGSPLLLERWLDDRFVPICELTADDIAFDGGHIGSGSDTVQEIIEEIWERLGGGCCEFSLEPPEGDAAGPIVDILQESQGEVTICFEPGVYTFTSTVDIDDRTVILKGCPRAVFIGDGADPIFNVIGTGKLVLDHLVVYARQADGTRVLIDVGANATGLDVRDTTLAVAPDGAPPSIAVRVIDEEPPAFSAGLVNPPNPPEPDGTGPPVRLSRALVAATWGISAGRLSRLEIQDSTFECAIGCVWAERSSSIDVRSTRLVAGVSLASVAAWTPEGLLSQRDGLFAPLGDLELPSFFPATNSVNVWMGSVVLGTVAGCQLVAGIGVAATNARLLDLHHNHYFVVAGGVHLTEAEACAISGETMFADDEGAAVIVGAASGLSVTDCHATAFTGGIGIGVIVGTNVRTIVDVRISGNVIQDVLRGIQVGPLQSVVYTGQLTGVSITDNTVQASVAGIIVNALATGGDAQPAEIVRRALARVADNTVASRIGIGVFGRDVEVSDNAVRVSTAFAPHFGVVGVLTQSLTVESNHIDVVFQAPGAGAPPGPQIVAAIGANIASAAIVLSNGSDASVAGNVTHVDDAVVVRSLSVDNHPRLSVKSNELLSGPAVCTNTDNIVFLDNTVRGGALISSAASGQVADNRVREDVQMKLEGDLEILSASGTWKVADNRADGTIRIVPTTTGGGFYPGWTDFGRYTYGAWEALDTIGNLSGNRTFLDLVNLPSGGGEAPIVDAAAPPGDAGLAAYAMSNAGWHENYLEAMETFIIADVSGRLVEVIGRGDIIIIRGQRESTYHVQCTANWSRDLQVGTLGTVIRVSTASVVQVISNRADEEMSIKPYTHLVMALNVAGDYTNAGNSQTQAINQLNLEI